MSMLARFVPLAALLLTASAALARPPDFPPPPDAKVRVVSDSMNVAGRQVAVRAFATDDSVEDVVEYYQELWADPPVKGAPGYAYEPDTIAHWELVTRVEDGYVLTVQVQPAGSDGARGLLAMGVLPDPGSPPAKSAEPPSMRGSAVVSDVRSEDPGKQGHTAMIVNEFSVDSNVNFYRTHFNGWRMNIDRQLASDTFHALSYTRGREQVNITVRKIQGGSEIVINSVRHDLL